MAEKKKTQAQTAASKSKSAARKTPAKAAAKSQASGKKTTGKNSRKEAAEQLEITDDRQVPVRLISSVAFLGLFILLLIMYFHPEGAFVKVLSRFLQGLFGRTSFLVAIPVALYLFFIHAFSGKRPVVMRTVFLWLFVIFCGCISHLTKDSQGLPEGIKLVGALYTGGIEGTAGGVVCGLITMLLHWLGGTVITYILLILAAVITLLGGMQITIMSIVRAVKNRPRPQWEEEKPKEEPQEPAAVVVNHIAKKRIEYLENKRAREAEVQANIPDEKKVSDILSQIESDVEQPVAAAGIRVEADGEPELIGQAPAEKTPEPLPEEASAEKAPAEEAPLPDPAENTPIPVNMPPLETSAEPVPGPILEAPAESQPVPAVQTVAVTKRKITAKEADTAADQVAHEIASGQNAETVQAPAYSFPPIDLLRLPGRSSADGTAEMRENSRRLNETLASFKIEAHIINVTRGPSVTRYEVELEKGVRLNKLTTAADDIALSLGATGVRIAAVPGKISVVGIEVPNRAVTMVSLREVIDSTEFAKAKSKSSFAVGKDIGGNCIIGNIARLPHMLIAGTTGSGKSVCMNSIIVSLLYKAGPEDVKLIMVDPKMVELGIYNGIPHLLIPVVTDPKKAAGSLQWAVTEMMRRYKAMSDAGVRDLESYNSIMESQDEASKKLPQIVVIIDELADLMLVAAKEVEESICRIAQMGRAAGIHLIIATQRPSADVITGLMKANIPSRIAFAVASAMESRIILDTQGAEKLVGKGDMLYAPIGNGKPRRVQGCFVSDPEVEAVANYVKTNYVTDYDQTVIDEIDRKAAQTGTKNGGSAPEPNQDELAGDEMLPAAVDVILDTKQASVSMLQRRLKLGYARAARIVDEMEELGVVGPFQGSKPREILITREQWEAMRSGGAPSQDTPDESVEVPCEEPADSDISE